MKRTLVVSALVLFVLGSTASVAMAQGRDPFDPVVDPNPVVDPGSGEVQPQPQPPFDANGSDASPNTGVDPSPYLMIAYTLIAAGAGALVLGKLRAPISARR